MRMRAMSTMRVERRGRLLHKKIHAHSPVIHLHTLTCFCSMMCSGQVVKGAPKNKVCGLAQGTC